MKNSFQEFNKNNPTNKNKNIKHSFEALVAFITTFIIIFLMMERTVNPYDEGIVLTAAMRISAGDIIHRDFYANYGPAEFYLLSWLFKLFGQQVLVERVLDICIRAGIVTLIYSSLVVYSRQWIALTATAICTLWLGTVGPSGYPIYPTLLLAMGSTLMLAKAFTHPAEIWRLFAAGALTGLSALFRYDVGFMAFAAHVLSAALIISLARKDPNPIFQVTTKKLFFYISGAALPVCLIILWYLKTGALHSFIHDIILFPIQYYASTRGLPFPVFSRFFTGFGFILFSIYMPIIICYAAIFGLCGDQTTGFSYQEKRFNYERKTYGRTVLIIFLTFLVAMFYLKSIVRVSIEHVQLSLLPSIVLLAILFEITKREKIFFNGFLAVLATALISTALLSGYKSYFYGYNLVLNDVKGFFEPADKKSIPMFFTDDDRTAAIQFIQQNTSPEQRTFIGLARHDKIFANDVSAYFLTNRLPATKWHHFDPGLQTSTEIQNEIIANLEASKPQYIWIESTWDGMREPNDSAKSSGIKILDEYIANYYQRFQTFGTISILQRKHESK